MAVQHSFDFKDRVALVTGAGEGIGLGLCQALARAGARVGLNDIDAELAEHSAAALNAELATEQVIPLAGDVAQPEVVNNLFDTLAAEIGPVDCVIANAGITRYIEFLETTAEMFDRIVSVNQRGAFFLAQAGAKQMIQANKPGTIILMSSVVGIQAYPNFSVYGMTKAALQMLARTLALELGAYGITVNAVSPGATLTPRTVREDPAFAENWATVSPTQRVGSIEDVVAAVMFLASEQARQISGQNLVVDGGWTIRSPLPENTPAKPVDTDT